MFGMEWRKIHALFRPPPREATVPLRPLGEKGLDPVCATWVIWDNPPGFYGETLESKTMRPFLSSDRHEARGSWPILPVAAQITYNRLTLPRLQLTTTPFTDGNHS